MADGPKGGSGMDTQVLNLILPFASPKGSRAVGEHKCRSDPMTSQQQQQKTVLVREDLWEKASGTRRGVGISLGRELSGWKSGRYPRADCEPLISHYRPLSTVRWGSAEDPVSSGFRMSPESCPRAKAPQFSPAISF